VEENDI
jgi:hypothetical protein